MCELQRVVGIRQNIKGGLVFYRPSTLFYIAGQIGIFHNLKDNSQKFWLISEKNEFTSMALGSKNWLALATRGKSPKVTMYNLKSHDKYVLSNPDKLNRFTDISSSKKILLEAYGNGYLAAQGGFPSWSFVMWNVERRFALTPFIPFRTELGAKVFKFVFHPDDWTRIVVVGQYFLRIYRIRSGDRFKEEAFHEQERSNKTFHSVAWIENSDAFAVGVSDGNILIFQGRQILQQIYLSKMLTDVPRIFSKLGNKNNMNVTCLLSTKEGLVCSYGGNSVLCLQRKMNSKDFAVVTSVHIPQQTEGVVSDSQIVQIILSNSEDTIVATTDDGQILFLNFDVPNLIKCLGYEADFKVMVNQQHKTRVVSVDTAISRAVQATCSSRTLILWDYIGRQFILQHVFDKEIQSVSIHPMSFNLLVGFKEGAKMFNILYNKIDEVQDFETKCSHVSFSEGGHMMAISNGPCIELYLSLTYEKYAEFTEQDGQITCIIWNNLDNSLLSTDNLGKIYEWDIPERKRTWSYSTSNMLFSKLAASKDMLYATTLDDRICLFRSHEKITEIEVTENVTCLLLTESMLLTGTETGRVVGYELSLKGNSIFERGCHQGHIQSMFLTKDEGLLLVTGEDGAISYWKLEIDLKETIPMFDEVLIDEKEYEMKLELIEKLERELQEETIKAEKQIGDQLRQQEAEKAVLKEKYQDIQNQLEQKLISLTEEKYNLQISLEQAHLDKVAAQCKESDEILKDFQAKLEKEKEHFQKLVDNRAETIEFYETQIRNIKEDIENSKKRLKENREKNECRIEELRRLLQEESETQERIMKKNEDMHHQVEEEENALLKDSETQLASRLELTKNENQILMAEIDELKAKLKYEKQCGLSLDAEYSKKKEMCKRLGEIATQLKERINRVKKDIEAKETQLKDKVSMTKVLEEDEKETRHLNSEADWKLQEYKMVLKEKRKESCEVKKQLEQLKSRRDELANELEAQQRKLKFLNAKMKSVEKSVSNCTQEILRTQLMLEHYRNEFIDETKNVDKANLRWALMKLYDKRVLKGRIKEEKVFVGDTDPFTKFCRQRDHYESLIDTVMNRKQEIQSAATADYVKLAKENSYWTAFAEALRLDVEQKREKIRILEDAVGLPACEFSKDPAETQRRFNKKYESLRLAQMQEEEEIQKKMELIKEQEKEIQRLHALVVVEEKGKVTKKPGLQKF